MFGLTVIDVAIGLIFLFLLYSLLATLIQEMLATIFNFRAKLLERAIIRMLEDGNLFDKRYGSIKALFRKESKFSINTEFSRLFYNSPHIKYLSEGKHNDKPSYISSKSFSKVIVEIILNSSAQNNSTTIQNIDEILKSGRIPNTSISISPDTLQQLQSIWTESGRDIEKFRKLLELWFDDTMRRCSGWYKKHTQYILLTIGIVIAVAFNVDSIQIAAKLQKDPELRKIIVQQADNFLKEHPDLYNKRTPNSTDKQEETLPSHSATADSITQRGIKLVQLADSLTKADLNKTNGLLGLGYSDFIETHSYTQKKDDNSAKASTLKIAFTVTLKYISTLIGWMLTAIALSLGAPFWFDLLNKLMKLRNSVQSGNSEESQMTKQE